MTNPIDNPTLQHDWVEVIPAGASGGSKMWECRHCQGLASRAIPALCPVRVKARLVALERVAALYAEEISWHRHESEGEDDFPEDCESHAALDALAAQEAMP